MSNQRCLARMGLILGIVFSVSANRAGMRLGVGRVIAKQGEEIFNREKEVAVATTMDSFAAPANVFSGNASLPTSGLVGHWNFDENTGTIAKDSSGNHYDATLVNGASWTTGKWGGGVRFSPSSNNAVTFPDVAQNSGFPSSGSLAFWVKVNFSAKPEGRFIDERALRNHIYVEPYQGECLRIIFQDEAGKYLNLYSQKIFSSGPLEKLPISNGEWTHIVIVWDTANGMAYFYKNGALATSFFWGGFAPSWTPRAQVFKFGHSIGSVFAGAIDDVALFRRPLMAPEISSLYNQTPAPIADTTVPEKPTNLAGNGLSPNKIALGWSPSTDNVGVGGYIIHRDGKPIGYASPASLSYVDSDLSPSTNYNYKVFAFDAAGNRSAASDTVNVRTIEPALLLNTNFEEASTVNTAEIGGWVKYGPNSNAVAITREMARAGSQSVKFTFNKEDWKGGVSNTNYYQRAQISQRYPVLLTLGQTFWTGISTFIPEDWQNDVPGNAELIWQFHGSTGGASEKGSPPLMLHIGGDTAAIKVLGDTSDKVYNPESTVSSERAPRPVIIYSSSLNADKGKWIDWVIETNFNYSNGFVKVWKNGEKIADYTGPTIYRTIGQTNENGPWFNFGPYKWGWGDSTSIVTNRTMYVDDVRQTYRPSCDTPACSGVAYPDTLAPTVSLIVPVPLAIVSGTQIFSATASDNVGVEGVQFKIGNDPLGEEDTTAPFSISWDTTFIPNGSHTLSAVARDAMGNRTTSETRIITILNPLAATPLSSGWFAARGNLGPVTGAWEFKESTVTGSHYVYLRSTSGTSTSDWLRFSVWVKRLDSGPARDISIYFYNSDATANRGTADCTLSGAGTSRSSAGGAATGVSSSVAAQGDGWYICSIVAKLDFLQGTKLTFNILATNGGILSYAGEPTAGFLYKNPKVEKF